MIQATPEPIKKTALAVFYQAAAPSTQKQPRQLKVFQPFSTEETNASNTAHRTVPPVANCQRVHLFRLSPADRATGVVIVSEMVCHRAGTWLIFRKPNEEIQLLQNALADLKSKTEEANQRHWVVLTGSPDD